MKPTLSYQLIKWISSRSVCFSRMHCPVLHTGGAVLLSSVIDCLSPAAVLMLQLAFLPVKRNRWTLRTRTARMRRRRAVDLCGEEVQSLTVFWNVDIKYVVKWICQIFIDFITALIPKHLNCSCILSQVLFVNQIFLSFSQKISKSKFRSVCLWVHVVFILHHLSYQRFPSFHCVFIYCTLPLINHWFAKAELQPGPQWSTKTWWIDPDLSWSSCLSSWFPLPFHFLTRPLLYSQSALAPLEPILPQEVPLGRQICAFLLAGHHSGVPQHSHHIIGALQPAAVADGSAGYVCPSSCFLMLCLVQN